MKKVKNISIILVVALIVNAFCFGASANSEMPLAQWSGVKLEENIVARSTNTILESTNLKNTELDITNFRASDNNIMVSGFIDGIPFDFNGQLYISQKCYIAPRYFVADMEDKNNNFRILYFEIKDNYGQDIYKRNESLSDKKCLSMDLVHKNGTKYYFELDLDNTSFDVKKINSNTLAEENIDYLQYIDVEKSTDVICTEPVQTYSSHENSGIGKIWEKTETVSGWFGSKTEYYYCAMGGFFGDIPDVPRYGTSIWTSKFEFFGHVRKNGEVANNYTNWFTIQAGIVSNSNPLRYSTPIELNLATGENTKFNLGKYGAQVKVGGVDKKVNTAAFKLIVGLIGSLNINPYVNGVTKLASLSASLFSSSNTLNNYTANGDTSFFVNGANPYIAANRFDTSISMDKNGHHLYFYGSAITVDSNRARNVNTNAKVVWKFNICHGNAFQNHDQATVTTSYLANAS